MRTVLVLLVALSLRTMPPFAVDNSGSCHTYKDARWLTDDELDLIAAWDAAGAPEGDGTPTGVATVLPSLDNPDVRTPPSQVLSSPSQRRP